jgi:antirestriction protein ArdC
MSKRDIYAEVTDRIIAKLEAGTVPWQRPYKMNGGFPISLSTGKGYRGINVLLLMLEGYDDPRWGTFKACQDAAFAEAKRQGRELVVETSIKNGRPVRKIWEIIDGEKVWFSGGVKKGEHGTHIVFWKRVERKEPKAGEDSNYWMLRDYVVFNAKQCNDIPALPEEEVREFTPIQQAEEIVSGYVWTPGSENPGPSVTYGYNHAAYNLTKDRLELPDPEQFHTDEGYYKTLFHELVHSTGSEKRLKRIETALFGTDPYAKEELVAEIGASFLAGIAEFSDAGGDQSAAYIANWLQALKDQPRLVIQAAAQAQKAVDLIVGTKFDEDDGKKEEAATDNLLVSV